MLGSVYGDHTFWLEVLAYDSEPINLRRALLFFTLVRKPIFGPLAGCWVIRTAGSGPSPARISAGPWIAAPSSSSNRLPLTHPLA
jgi:hypothetical protein